jgi:hypothetical protein
MWDPQQTWMQQLHSNRGKVLSVLTLSRYCKQNGTVRRFSHGWGRWVGKCVLEDSCGTVVSYCCKERAMLEATIKQQCSEDSDWER